MKKILIIVLCVLIFIFSVLCGFLLSAYNNFSKKNENNESVVLAQEDNKKIVDTSAKDEIVSPNALVVQTQKFSKCGHVLTNKQTVPREIVNLNRGQVEEFYKDWKIDSFTTNEICISKINYGICDEHYVLRESDGYISINCKNDIGEYIFKGLTDISTQYLPQEDLDKLQRGIEVVGRDNLNKCLEDFE